MNLTCIPTPAPPGPPNTYLTPAVPVELLGVAPVPGLMIEFAVVTDDLLVSTTNVVSIGVTIPLVPVDRVPITVLLGNVNDPSAPKVHALSTAMNCRSAAVCNIPLPLALLGSKFTVPSEPSIKLKSPLTNLLLLPLLPV